MKELTTHQFHILLLMFILISFMLGCNEFMVVGNLSLIAGTYHESLGQISWLVAAFAWTYAIVTPLVALGTNHFNKYYLLMGMLLIFLLGTILSACSPTLPIFLFSRIITASVAGMIESLLSVIAYQLTQDPRKRAMAIAYVYTGFSLASVIGVPIGTIIANHWRWQDAFIMVAIITALATLIALLFLPRDLAGEAGNYRTQLVLLKDRQVWVGIFFVICAAATLYGYYTYIRPLIRQALHFSANQLSIFLLILGVIDILASQTSGKIAAKGGFKTLRPIYIGNLLLLILFSFFMNYRWSGSLLLVILGYTVNLFGSPIQVFFLNLANHKYPTAIMLASTLSAIFYNVGIALASISAGQVLKHWGLTSLGWNSLIYCLIATGLAFILAKINFDHRAQ
ncbi:MFS transporter [Limosilactobacillus sp.]|uniref:MFS transporter n=1 Tax=Limosilactobacillus sp. TaxID=2773925 RepID=UPI003F0388C5